MFRKLYYFIVWVNIKIEWLLDSKYSFSSYKVINKDLLRINVNLLDVIMERSYIVFLIYWVLYFNKVKKNYRKI